MSATNFPYLIIKLKLEAVPVKAYGGVEVKLHEFLTPALDGGEWSASQYRRVTPRDGLSCPRRESNPGRPVRDLVTVLTS
jgi:hypothetical protein